MRKFITSLDMDWTVVMKDNNKYKLDPVEIVETGHKRDYLGIASLIIVLFALLIIANEALGNPLLDFLTK